MKLKDMSFQELVREGINYELDAVVECMPLKSRVHQITALAAVWADLAKKQLTSL
jgi:hypothetical protein